MIELKQIDEKVEKVLEAPSVSWAQKVMQSRSGLWIIGMISFVESALPLPILTDPFLAAGILLNRQRTIFIVLLTTMASVLGGLFAYISAAYFFEILSGYMSAQMTQEFDRIVSDDSTSTGVLTLVGAVTPIPYTLVAWAVAVIEGSVLVFILISVLGRGFRYSVVGYCTYWFGPSALRYAQRYLGFTSLIILVLAGLYVYLKM